MSVITTKGNVSKNQTINTEGGKSMKKMVKNNKGFSLIELLIVVAILAILAAISINLFGGVLNRQKDKSDKAAASYLQTAIQTYIAETDDATLTNVGKDDFSKVTTALATKTKISVDGKDVDFGPYLNNGAPKLSSSTKGFKVIVDDDNQSVTVTVIDGASDIDFN